MKVGLMFLLKLLAGASLAASTLLPFASARAQAAQPPAPAAPVAPPATAAAPATVPAQPQAVTDAAREQDAIFQQLREAARQNDAGKAAELAARLPNYAIPSYVDYYRLKPRLKDASNEEVLEFLKRYEGSAIADRLRNDWLLELGRKRDWARSSATPCCRAP
jgi:soluble lytic murein transglycosylase